MRILIVEDEHDILLLIAEQLGGAGFESDGARSIFEASKALETIAYDLVLLDRRLPDGDGLSFISKIRELRPQTRIIMLTARDAPYDKARGLDAGADDYLAKPYDEEELLARIRARLRHADSRALPPISVGRIRYEPPSGQIFVSNQLFVMHRREFHLLDALLRRVNQVAPRKALLVDVYGDDEAVSPGALDTLVSRLRRRLMGANAGVAIHLVRGRGYLLTEELACGANLR